MKQIIAIVFCILLFISSFTGCAGPTTRIKDKGVTAEVAVGAQAAGTAETPAEKTYVNKKGKFEISSTPFGYVKRKKKQTEKESSAPVPGQQESVVPLTPVVKTPAAAPAPAAPPALKAEPTTPVPVPSEKLAGKNVP